MKKSNLVAHQNQYLNNGSKYKDITAEKIFVNCVIADETPKTLPGNLLGFLIGIKPILFLKAKADAEINPLDSIPAM